MTEWMILSDDEFYYINAPERVMNTIHGDYIVALVVEDSTERFRLLRSNHKWLHIPFKWAEDNLAWKREDPVSIKHSGDKIAFGENHIAVSTLIAVFEGRGPE